MKTTRESSLGSEFQTGEWKVQPEACRIIRENKQFRLRPMMMNLLVTLAENAGQVLTKDRILEMVWEADFVSESSLTREIAELRRILGDTWKDPQYIETIPKRGYRYIAPVQPSKGSNGSRLAVLPFANLNKNPELDYFADGISDSLITELGSVGSLRVISRQSVLHYKNSDKNLSRIARELKVDVVVDGSVLNVGNRVRITAQLIQVEPEKHLWAKNYECEIGDILEIQARVANSIADFIRAALTPEAMVRLSRKIPGDPEVHRTYLKARFLIMTWNQADMQTGFKYLNEVIRRDPEFAPAYDLMANCLFALGFWGYLPPRVVYPQARAAAVKAIELDQGLSAAHATFGLSNLVLDWNPVMCEQELVRAIQLNPSNTFARISYALFLVTIPGDYVKAVEEARLGLDTDPLSEHMNFAYAWILFFAGEYDRAKEHALKALKMYRDSLHLHFILGWAHLGSYRFEEGITAFQKAVEISRDTIGLGYLGYACGLAGRKEATQAILSELVARSASEEIPLTSLAYINIGLGDFDKAIESLERCLEERDGRILWFPPTVFSGSFLADPRYRRLLKRLRASIYQSRAV